MPRIAYISDSHLGADAGAYQQQTGCYAELPRIFAAMWKRLRDERVDLVLHGGDLIHATSDCAIANAAELLDGDLPVRVCLGNHDLTTTDARERWLALAPELFADGQTDYTITKADCAIHVVPNQWCEQPWLWRPDGDQDPHLLPAQWDRLDAALTAHADRPQILLTHAPVFGLPPEQTGFDEPYHDPGAKWRDPILALAARHPSLRLVLGGHNHLNLCVEQGGAHYVTVSALAETPHELKIIDVDADGIRLRTVSLADRMPPLTPYNHDRSYVQGRPCDRGFEQYRAAD